jgi:two-component system, NarL family, response regulator NreC
MLTIVLADDHAIVRQGLHALLTAELECEIVAEAADGITAVRLVTAHRPAVLIVDLIMPGMNGLEVTRQVRSLPMPPAVIILSMHADETYVLDALRSGASAYVLKESDTLQLAQAVRAVVAGQRYLSPPLSERAIDAYIHQTHASSFDALEMLTAREREILMLAADGYSNTAIAARFTISVRTVETHRTNLMRKLDLHTQTELVRFAAQHGLSAPPANPTAES